MRAGIFIWNTKADYTNGRIPIDDSKGPMSVALMKVNDGLEYQTYSPEDSRQWADGVFRPQGIDWMPWGVARGWNEEVARNEGRLAGQHAAASRSEYILDLEPDPKDYWQGIPGTPRAFCEGYGETSEGRNLRLCPDARNPGINIEEWAAEPIVSIWHPQMYATAFGESLDRWLTKGTQPILDLGVPQSRVFPVLAAYYATDGEPSISPDDLERDILHLAQLGYPGFALWRRGCLSAQAIERMLSMHDPFTGAAPAPPPAPSPPTHTFRIPDGATIAGATVSWSE